MSTRIKYTREILEPIVASSTSVYDVLRKLGLKLTGGTHSHIKQVIRKLSLDTSHFTGRGHNKGKQAHNRLHWSEVLVKYRSDRREHVHVLRRALIDSGVPEKCLFCGLSPRWRGKVLVLEIDHINGDFLDNTPNNLRFLCPNCHSQTETSAPYKAKRLKVRYGHFKGCQRPEKQKVPRPNREELAALLWSKPTSQIATELGVSSVAVAKWAKLYQIPKPPRGYWAKLRARVDQPAESADLESA